jgi:hypothetical protein
VIHLLSPSHSSTPPANIGDSPNSTPFDNLRAVNLGQSPSYSGKWFIGQKNPFLF